MKKSFCFITAMMLLALMSCSNDTGTTSTTIRVKGTAGDTAVSRSASTAFASGKVFVNDKDITAELKAVKTSNPGQNNVDFEATTEVVVPEVKLFVEPKQGYIFDEWEEDFEAMKRDGLSYQERKALRLTEKQSKAETLVVRPEAAKYYKASFDEGFYLDFNAITDGDGSKATPFKSFEALKNHIVKADDIEDELTIKIAGSADVVIDLSTLSQIEELSLIGGFNSSWDYTGDRSSFQSIILGGLADDLELEIENIEVKNFNISTITSDDIEFRNFSVENLSASDNAVIANMIVTGSVSGENLTFINSVVSGSAGYTYYHSIVKGGENIKGENNIILAAEKKVVDGNIFLLESDYDGGYKVLTDNENLRKARCLAEDILGDDFEDFIEEDITGFERPEADDGENPYVSYGPYEYNR